MPNGKMDTVQVEDAVMGRKWTLSPGFILFSQGLVEATHCAGAGGNSHQDLSDLPHFMIAHSIHKHLGQCFSHLRFIPVVTLENLAVERSFSISGFCSLWSSFPGLSGRGSFLEYMNGFVHHNLCHSSHSDNMKEAVVR